MNFSKAIKSAPALVYATGTADRNGLTIDTAGFQGVALVVQFATIAASGVNSIKAQAGDASDLSDAADIAGTSQAVAVTDDDEIRIIDIVKPPGRYVRVVIDKDATNACAESAVAHLYDPDAQPTTVPSTSAGELHVSPAYGTA